MTTCIWDMNRLYTDSLVSDYYIREIQKYRILKDGKYKGNLVFGAGDLYTLNLVWDWLENDVTEKPIIKDDDDKFTSVMVTQYNELYIFDHKLCLVKVPNQRIVIGSGYEYVMGALAAGADARRAIEIACMYDSASGGNIQELNFDTGF